jgi:hypothetical protein
MDAVTRGLVQQRAADRCEYCHFPDDALDLPFHVEHIVARQHRGADDPANLCWACSRCNLKKGPNLSTVDFETGKQVALFNPRTMIWNDHFMIQGARIIGITACGRGTVELLDMNNETRLAHRQKLISQGEFIID